MIVFYARVSTTEQTTAHQRTQAEAAGFKIDKVLSDEGVSGVSTRLAERPQGKRLFDMLRAGDTLSFVGLTALGETTPTWWTRSESSCRHHGPDATGRPRCTHRLHGGHGTGAGRGNQVRPARRH